MEMFRKDQNLIDTLLPELTGEEAPAVFGHNKWVPVHKALRYMVLREFTTGVRRTDCLESMGLARVDYEGVDAREQGPASTGPRCWASRPEEAVEAVCLLLDNWRRNRILYVTGDPIFSRYHAKDDPYIQAGLLPLREFRPEGLLLTAGQTDRLRPWPDRPEGCLGGPGPRQEVGDQPRHARRGRGRRRRCGSS